MILNKESDLEIFKKAALIRAFEEKVFILVDEKKIRIPVYLSAGQEYISATFATFFEEVSE